MLATTYQTANCPALAVGNDNTENAGLLAAKIRYSSVLTFFCGGDDGRGTPAVPFFCPSEPQQFCNKMSYGQTA